MSGGRQACGVIRQAAVVMDHFRSSAQNGASGQSEYCDWIKDSEMLLDGFYTPLLQNSTQDKTFHDPARPQDSCSAAHHYFAIGETPGHEASACSDELPPPPALFAPPPPTTKEIQSLPLPASDIGDGEDAWQVYCRGATAELEDRPSEALGLYELACERSPSEPLYLYQKASLSLRLTGDVSEALEALETLQGLAEGREDVGAMAGWLRSQTAALCGQRGGDGCAQAMRRLRATADTAAAQGQPRSTEEEEALLLCEAVSQLQARRFKDALGTATRLTQVYERTGDGEEGRMARTLVERLTTGVLRSGGRETWGPPTTLPML